MTTIPYIQALPLQQRLVLLQMMVRCEVDADYLADNLDIAVVEAQQAIDGLVAAGLAERLQDGWTYTETGWETLTAMIAAGTAGAAADDPSDYKLLLHLLKPMAAALPRLLNKDLLQFVVELQETTAYNEAEADRETDELIADFRQWKARRTTDEG